MINNPPLDQKLDLAMRTYATTFGHVVPDEVVEMFARRAWLLTSEIQQAIAMQRPVRAWQERAKNGPPLGTLNTAR